MLASVIYSENSYSWSVMSFKQNLRRHMLNVHYTASPIVSISLINCCAKVRSESPKQFEMALQFSYQRSLSLYFPMWFESFIKERLDKIQSRSLCDTRMHRTAMSCETQQSWFTTSDESRTRRPTEIDMEKGFCILYKCFVVPAAWFLKIRCIHGYLWGVDLSL